MRVAYMRQTNLAPSLNTLDSSVHCILWSMRLHTSIYRVVVGVCVWPLSRVIQVSSRLQCNNNTFLVGDDAIDFNPR